jgi:TIR domain
MAFLPSPIEHDLFLSYAHEDQAWVNALEEQLTERLRARLGPDCEIWQDVKHLRTGDRITEELYRAIRASAAFVTVISRNYPTEWTEKELAEFREEAEKEDPLETGGHRRLLKVIKFPWVDNAHDDFYPEYKHIAFFDAKDGREREFPETSARFRNAVDELSAHVEKLFRAMQRGLVNVFVARAAADANEEREALIREIRAAGFAISPPPNGVIAAGLDRKRLRKFIDDAGVSVHLLGAVYDRSVREHIDLALESGKKMIFYLARGYEAATGEQKALIDEIRANKWGLPGDKRDFLNSRSPAAQRQDVIDQLRPAQPADAAAARSAAARVYLLCDPTSEDAGFGRELQGKIRETEKFEVALPQAAAEASSPAAEHERLLRWCDGLLLYHERAPATWYRLNFKDLVTTEERKSRALLVAGSNLEVPGITVIQRPAAFRAAILGAVPGSPAWRPRGGGACR